jgi:predicted Zn-dependent protease
MKRSVLILAAVLVAASFAAVSAQEKMAPGAHECKATALDAETKVAFEKLKLQYKLAVVDLKAEQEKLHEELMNELMSEETSSKSIDKLVKALDANHGKMMEAKMDYMLKVKKLMPADHFKAFLHKQYMMKGHGGMSCAAAGPGHKCGDSCSRKMSGCSKAGMKGHACTSACRTSEKPSCKVPCRKAAE